MPPLPFNPVLLILPLIFILVAVSIALYRRPVGGWLLFFCGHIYIIVVSAFLLTLFDNRVFLTLHSLGPERYIALLAARLPILATGIAVAVALTVLLIRSDWNDLVRLRYMLLAQISAGLLSSFVDLKYFPTAAPQRIGGLLTFCTWAAYFYLSARVRRVFLTHDWQ